jgi:hypothetical protein
MKRKLLLSLHVTFWLALLSAVGYIALHPTETRYALRDWWRLRSYEVPAHIAKLADEIALTGKAENIFYASQPELKNKFDFVVACPFPEQSFVIGCYDGDHIYILDVREKDLESVEPVTAAHELLHAVWARHSQDHQKDLTRQLRAVFTASNDQDLRDLINKYQNAGNDIDTINSELHSILATEVDELTPELEQYYGQYFTNRGRIVQQYNSYRAIFARNQDQVDALKARLDQLKSQLDTIQTELSVLRPVVETQNAQLDVYAQTGDADNYNRLLRQQRSDVNQYNRQVRRYNTLVEEYRSLAKELLALSLRHNELVDAIDATKIQKIEGE